MFGEEEEAGRGRARQGQGLVRDSGAQGVSSTPAVGSTQFKACYPNWFSDQQDGHCLRVCRIQNLRPRSRPLESELTGGLCSLGKFQKLCSKTDAVLGQSISELRYAPTGKTAGWMVRSREPVPTHPPFLSAADVTRSRPTA